MEQGVCVLCDSCCLWLGCGRDSARLVWGLKQEDVDPVHQPLRPVCSVLRGLGRPQAPGHRVPVPALPDCGEAPGRSRSAQAAILVVPQRVSWPLSLEGRRGLSRALLSLCLHSGSRVDAQLPLGKPEAQCSLFSSLGGAGVPKSPVPPDQGPRSVSIWQHVSSPLVQRSCCVSLQGRRRCPSSVVGL